MSRIRQLGKESLLYGASSLGSRFLNFLLVPFYTHVFAPDVFGILQMVFVLIAFLNVVYQFGFDTAYIRLASDKEAEAKKNLFSSAFLSVILGSILWTVVLLFSMPLLGKVLVIPTEYRYTFFLAAGILCLDALAIVPLAQLRVSHRALYFSGSRFLYVIVNIIANLVFILHLHMGVKGILWANVLASACALVYLTPVYFQYFRMRFDVSLVKQLLSVGWPLVPSGLYLMVNEMAGRWFLAQRADSLAGDAWVKAQSEVGIFSAAWKLGIFGALLVQMYRLAWQPFFLQHRNDSDAPQLFGQILRLWLTVIGWISIPILFFLDYWVSFPIAGRPLIHPDYWGGLAMVPIVFAAYGLQAVYVHFTLGPLIAKQTKALMTVTAWGAVATVLGNYLLVEPLGLWGASLAAAFCYGAMALLMAYKSQKLFRIDLSVTLIPVFIWLTAIWGLSALGLSADKAPSLSFRLLAALLFLIAPLLFGGIKPNELVIIKNLFQRKSIKQG